MTLFAVLGTGPSLKREDVESLTGRCKVVAVSDAYRMAPRADALASFDRKWWDANPEAKLFPGRKFCGVETNFGERLKLGGLSNSGLFGMYVAEALGASRIILLGFDMRGSHFFGNHRPPLSDTPPERFEIFQRQFARWNGCPVINCTPLSALEAFPFAKLETIWM